ncbi:hypothetical protein E2C01_067922 [Portunus trituberculatus]|uniref:Uncharacterized protein n=1 Tax=Portunus trituberculatus TaxID=210409 RepID=A0A5B7HY40_PORTR|nr:hypothetical protein [Portunus trituberculatus]
MGGGLSCIRLFPRVRRNHSPFLLSCFAPWSVCGGEGAEGSKGSKEDTLSLLSSRGEESCSPFMCIGGLSCKETCMEEWEKARDADEKEGRML